MACGIPVIASPVGANIDVVSPESGFLASSPEDWLNSLRRLRDDPSGRRKMGESGRLQVIENYSLTRNLPLLAQVIRQVASK
jgi:glycosyltransferase involved in cell wall biosynthesis